MRRILEELVRTEAVSAADMANAISKVGERKAERELLATGKLNSIVLAQNLATNHGISYLDLSEESVDPTAVAKVSSELARRHYVMPISITGNTLTLAVVDPADVIALDDISTATGMLVKPVVVTREAMGSALDRYIRLDNQIADLTSELRLSNETNEAVDIASEVANTDEEAPLVRFVNLLITQAIQDRASDIHIDPHELSVRVRYRIDGVLQDVQEAPKSMRDGIVSRLKIMSGIDIAEKRVPQDGRISVKHMGRAIDLRVATLPTVWGEKIVMRILDNSASKLNLADMRMSQNNLATFRSAFQKPHGMVLVTGPTGSGKSTTLYATLAEIARPEINVITVEDPVEYRMDGVAQMQVNTKAGLTFARALRSILRGDPDVVLLGEIRDSETADIAIEAALTGHLVLSTLHTNDAPSAITRLIEMGVEPFLVSSAIEAIVAQRLARKLCDYCKKSVTPDPVLLQSFDFHLPAGVTQIGEPVGCGRCSKTGYRGRVSLHEVMPMTSAIQSLAVARASGSEIRQQALKDGMTSLREDGWQKILAGVTSIEEVIRVAA